MMNEDDRLPAGHFYSAFRILTSAFDSMEIKKGIGVSPGVVISTAVVLDAEDMVIPKRPVEPDQVAGEVQRLQDAIVSALDDLTKLRDQVASQHGKEIGGIFDVHMALLKDKSLVNQ